MWLTVKEYSEKEGITRQATEKRIKNKHIPPARVRKNDGGKIEIKVRELLDPKDIPYQRYDESDSDFKKRVLSFHGIKVRED